MRVVFDTNIFISALILPGGSADTAIMRIINGDATLVISREIIDETLTVLSRKFRKMQKPSAGWRLICQAFYAYPLGTCLLDFPLSRFCEDTGEISDLNKDRGEITNRDKSLFDRTIQP